MKIVIIVFSIVVVGSRVILTIFLKNKVNKFNTKHSVEFESDIIYNKSINITSELKKDYYKVNKFYRIWKIMNSWYFSLISILLLIIIGISLSAFSW